MASLSPHSHLNKFLCNSSSLTSNRTPKPSISFPCLVEFSVNPIRNPRNSTFQVPRRPALRAKTSDDEWGGGDADEAAYVEASGVAVAEEEKAVEVIETERLKKALVDSFYGTDRGLKASSETRAEIVELITQLEAKNPNPAPTEALTLLNGKWILA